MLGLNKILVQTQAVLTAAVFNLFTGFEAGAKGGKSQSPKKQRAARANGRQGGRPRKRTLAEYLLRRRLVPEQHSAVDNALRSMTLSVPEQEALLAYFGVDRTSSINVQDFRPRERKPNAKIRYIMRKFRMEVNHRLKDLPPPRPLRPYVVVYEPRRFEEQEVWEQCHPSVPCPPRAKRIYFRKMPCYRHYDWFLSRNPEYRLPTAEHIKAAWGAEVTHKIAQAIVADLRARYPKAATG